MERYGYVRVSSQGQNEDRQFIAMYEEGIERKNIFLDKQSGRDFNRPEYKKLLKKLKPGDNIFVHSIDLLYKAILLHLPRLANQYLLFHQN